MTNTLNTLQDQILKLEKELQEQTELLNFVSGKINLSPDVQPHLSVSHGKKSFAWIYKDSNMVQFNKLFKLFSPYINKTFISRDGQTVSFTKQDGLEIHPVRVEVSHRDTYPRFDFQIGKYRIGVKVYGNFKYLAFTKYRTYHERYVAKDGTKLVTDLSNSSHIKWASAGRDYPNPYTVYWVSPEQPDFIEQ